MKYIRTGSKSKQKKKEKTAAESQLLSRKLVRYTRTLPPLISSMKISQKAAAAGFEWEDVEGVWGKFSRRISGIPTGT